VPRPATFRNGARRELRCPVVVGRPMLGTKHTWGLKAFHVLVSTYVQNRVLAKTAGRNVTEAGDDPRAGHVRARPVETDDGLDLFVARVATLQ
jgi:hypothetical protein